MHFMIKRDQFVAPIKTNCFAASLVLLPIIQQEELTGMASERCYKNQNPSYRSKFHLNFDQGKENFSSS